MAWANLFSSWMSSITGPEMDDVFGFHLWGRGDVSNDRRSREPELSEFWLIGELLFQFSNDGRDGDAFVEFALRPSMQCYHSKVAIKDW